MAKKIKSWLKDVLPEDFEQKQTEFLQMQAFLQQFFKKEVQDQIQLMSCVSQKIVLAAKSPQVATYIKMQQNRLLSAMEQQLGTEYRLLIKTNPNSLKAKNKTAVPPARRSMQASITLQQTSQTIKDKDLRASLQRLAKSIKQD